MKEFGGPILTLRIDVGEAGILVGALDVSAGYAETAGIPDVAAVCRRLIDATTEALLECLDGLSAEERVGLSAASDQWTAEWRDLADGLGARKKS